MAAGKGGSRRLCPFPQGGRRTCHSLHHLQMVTEKIAKAYFWRSGSPPPKSHAGFVQFLRFLGKFDKTTATELRVCFRSAGSRTSKRGFAPSCRWPTIWNVSRRILPTMVQIPNIPGPAPDPRLHQWTTTSRFGLR